MTSQIATDLTIMDGGMGSELLKRSGQRGGLWSAQALLDAPETVAQVHQDYIDAGARLIITNTYSTVPSYLQKGGWQDRFLELATLAGQIARDVADQGPDHVRVAGSLPPLNESYRFDLVPPAQEAASVLHSASPGVDALCRSFYLRDNVQRSGSPKCGCCGASSGRSRHACLGFLDLG